MPSIEGKLDSWQFDVLVDVIHHVMLIPPPPTALLLPNKPPPAAAGSGGGGGVMSSSEVAAAAAVVSDLRALYSGLQHELGAVAPGAVAALWAPGAADLGA